MQVPTFIWWSLRYSGEWPSVPYAGLCVYLLAGCKKLCGVTLFCNISVLRCYGSLNTLPSPVDTSQSQFKSRSTAGKVGSLYKCSPAPHQSRGGSYSELSCLGSEVILSITSELINPGVCCILLFSPGGIACIYIYVEVVSLEPSSLFYFWTSLSICFVFWSRLYTLLWDITSWSSCYVPVRNSAIRVVTEVTLRIWV